MSIFKLTINKGNLVRYLRSQGYMPSEKRARFLQKIRPQRSWELTWKEPKGEHKATVAFAGGKVGICIQGPGGDQMRTIHTPELLRFGMAVEEKGSSPVIRS